MSFLQASLDLFTGARTGHLVGDHYVAHAGVRDGKSMSGPKLWTEAEAAREAQGLAGKSNLVSAEVNLLRQVAAEILGYLPLATYIVELGPGTIRAFMEKTLLIIRALQTKEITLVDGSAAFLKDIVSSNAISGIKIRPIEDDFFEGKYLYYDGEKPALACTFGSTISNIVAPRSDELPEKALIASLTSFSQAIGEGWLLVGFDSNQDGNRLKSYYEAASPFFLSIFDRMAVELPISGGFDPKVFNYEADWNPRSGQIAHMAIANRDLQFTLAGREISIRKGQEFHMKNAYKFSPEFFEWCREQAGLEIVKAWSDASPAKVYLLKKSRRLISSQVPLHPSFGKEIAHIASSRPSPEKLIA